MNKTENESGDDVDFHNKIIENLQTVVENLNTKLDQQEKNMKKMIEDNMNNNKVDDTNLEFYKNKIMTIDNSLKKSKSIP